MEFLENLQAEFRDSAAWIELICVLVSLAVAYGSTVWVGRRAGAKPESVWFGRSTFDGLMFPLLSLALVYAARVVVGHHQPVFILKAAIPILVSLAVIRFFARVLSAAFPSSGPMRLLERLVSWLAWGVAVLWITGLLPSVLAELESIHLTFGKTTVTLRTLIEGVLSSGLVLVVALWVSSTLERQVLMPSISDLSMRRVAVNAMRAALLLLGLLFGLSAVGVDLTALSVLGGAVGVGLGFGLQKLAANYVSGFVILLERSLRIGDNVRVDNFEGQITDIKTRYTLLRAPNGKESIVPNETMVAQRVENLSAYDQRFNMSTNVVVAYHSDVQLVQQVMRDAALAQERVLKDPAPIAYLLNFAADGLEFSLHFWIADPSKGQFNIRSDVNLAVLAGLRAAGVELPFPQRVLHVQGGGAVLPPVPVAPAAPAAGAQKPASSPA
ncbi:mechanosensitive ion channel [Curvibacter sp. HBC61]|uniref:Mechanosensitive ion channel n=1 Tax=Curvibacter cyanobacteriorum TaxID=3026422 RepID=A0ABT5MUG7_9BURK|nr:mechanosensitive ion channel domain-containing protein [Curvibacter sp. HBC61]MDD0837009.1 mechanosensitive ion channel [Curvibacter sp. HBC61]